MGLTSGMCSKFFNPQFLPGIAGKEKRKKMGKRFVRIELPDEDDPLEPEIILIDLERISHCEIVTGEDGAEWYAVIDDKGTHIVEIDVNLMRHVAGAIENAAAEANRLEWLRDTDN